MQDVQLEHTYSSSVTMLDVAWKTCQGQWTIGRGGGRESEIFVVIARHDYDDDKYLGILETDSIKQVEMKEKIKKEYLMWTRKLHKIKLCHRNLIKGIITWAVSVVRYSGPFFKWTTEELKQMDLRRRKLMTFIKHYILEMTFTDYMYQISTGEKD